LKLQSFGCSFIYGSELKHPDRSWPALIAQDIGLEYANHAVPGSGNLRIAESILSHSNPNDLHIIGWTWIDRFDYVDCASEQWHTLRPKSDTKNAKFYFRNLHAQYRDMLTNLMYVSTAIKHLQSICAPFVMTAMDRLLFEVVQDTWHDSRAVINLQNCVRPMITNFQGMTFLEWSRFNQFLESELWHPLDDAHAAAADLILPVVKSLIN
jgi:predicted RNA-binding protein with PUA-like domain